MNFFMVYMVIGKQEDYSLFGLKETKRKIQDYLERYYQIGVAPYLGDYGDLHTWIIG